MKVHISPGIYQRILDDHSIEGKVLLLPTGNTPIPFYEEIRRRHIDFGSGVTFNLDEYVNPAEVDSYSHYMRDHLFRHVDVRHYLLDGCATDPEAECQRYRQLLAENPIDIAFLGIGVNGHIAFNEPGSEASCTTRLVVLTESTQRVNNTRYNQGLTVGIGEILSSKKIILMATGEQKAEIISALVHGQITTDLPASLLKNHPDFSVYLDPAAASKLQKGDLVTVFNLFDP